MKYIQEADLPYLKNKYHDTTAEFNPFRRMFYHGGEYDLPTGLSDEAMDAGLKALFDSLSAEEKPHSHTYVKGMLFSYVLDHAVIDVNPHDYFVGFYNWSKPLLFAMTAWKKEIYAAHPENAAIEKSFTASGTCALWPDFDHVIPNWDALLSLGFSGILSRVKAYKAQYLQGGTEDEVLDFFDGMIFEYEAILRLLGRYEALAKAKNHPKAREIAASVKRLQNGAPETFFDALQALYLFFMLCEHVDLFQTRSMGNGLDRTLLPFYEKAMKSGTENEQALSVYLAYFLFQFSAIDNYWGQPLYLGGSDEQGRTYVNGLSHLIVDVRKEIGIFNPKIQIKLDWNTPDDFLLKVCRYIREGDSSFVFCCAPGYEKAISAYADSKEECRTFEISGCYESRVRHDESSAVVGYVSAVKPVLFVLNNGIDEKSGARIGLETGPETQYETFEQFYEAYEKQWNHVIDTAMRMGTEFYDPNLALVNPSPMFTATNERPLRMKTDGYAYGMKYNNSSLLNCCFASGVDALMAIKKLVFDEKFVTLSEYKNALKANYEGYGDLYHRARSLPEKYGNHNEEADALAEKMSLHFANRVNGKPNGRGGIYKAFMHTARMFVVMGERTGATPEGRKAGEEFSKNASPSVGMDRNGVTALILSALRLHPTHYPESFCVDLMLHPSAVEGEDGLAVMKGLLHAYMAEGGLAIQFNVFSVEMLRDAQEHPEKYENLQVRVCGWNVLWNKMSRAEQDAYILRAANMQH